MYLDTLKLSIFTTLLTIGIALPTTVNANFLEENEVALGLQNTLSTGGLSAKVPLGDGLTLQGIFGASGTLLTFTGRGLLEFSEINEEAKVYAFAGAGVFTFRGSSFVSRETAVGASLGVGADWDLQKSNPDWLPINLSVEAGASFVAFDDFTGFDLFTLGFGAHYRF